MFAEATVEYRASVATAHLETGHLLEYDQWVYRVLTVAELPDDEWPADYTRLYEQMQADDGDDPGEPQNWAHRPLVVLVQPDHGENREHRHREITAASNHQWRTLEEHYTVCVHCGERPPCQERQRQEQERQQVAQLQWAMSILPGCCHACGEPVTQRQAQVRFAGPNLTRPDFDDDTAVFHTAHSAHRGRCLDQAARYDKRWSEQTGNPRKFAPIPGTDLR